MLDAQTLLAVADSLEHSARLGVIDGIIHDLEPTVTDESADVEVLVATRCVEAELAILTGTPERSCELLALPIANPPTDGPGRNALDRLTLAGSHGLRVIGATDRAYESYSQLEGSDSPPVRLQALLWRADLDMARGRFRSAHALCDRLEATAGDDLELLADTYRLRHLTYRWSFRFDQAALALAEARALYERAESRLGAANSLTNAVELSAWINPAECLANAEATLAAQRELGALHEVGKATSAVALAHLLLDDVDAADLAASEAVDILERARYRSGHARALLVRAYIAARGGDRNSAVTHARACADELTAANVYPTLIWLAMLLQDDAGYAEATEADIRLLVDTIEPEHGDDQLEARVLEVHRSLRGV
jgi:hypothetical protein